MKTTAQICHLLCHLLCHLRDWPHSRRPYSTIIILLALHEAGDTGLSARQIGKHLDRDGNGGSAAVEPLLKSGLVNLTASASPTSKHNPGIYRITAAGCQHALKLFQAPESKPAVIAAA